MKYILDIIIVILTIVFGVSFFSWTHNFTPSVIDVKEIKVLVKKEDEL
jgi:hypothetical protein